MGTNGHSFALRREEDYAAVRMAVRQGFLELPAGEGCRLKLRRNSEPRANLSEFSWPPSPHKPPLTL